MTAVLQRVKSASVTVDGEIVGKCKAGLLILAGFVCGDSEEDLRTVAKKAAELRIFPDEGGKMSRSVIDIGGEILVVPNFTLAASCRHGRRPDFMNSLEPDTAREYFAMLAEELRALGVHTECGEFGADMTVDMSGDGPVTIILESGKLGVRHTESAGV